MDRRVFLKQAGALATGTVVRSSLDKPRSDPQFIGRRVMSLNRNWRYLSSVPTDGHARDFDDSHFDRITLPHSNALFPWHAFDDTGYEFVSLYRRHFRLPRDSSGARVFVDFEGVMAAAKVSINGVHLGEYRGGYTPFSFELTRHLDYGQMNVLAVEVDSRERPDIPPFGGVIDYLTFGGIYRTVSLRLVPTNFIENVLARPRDVLTALPSLDLECHLATEPSGEPGLVLDVALLEDNRLLAATRKQLNRRSVGEINSPVAVSLEAIRGVSLWDIDSPRLYTVRIRMLNGQTIIDEDSRRIGFREAEFTDTGFKLNGRSLKLRGLNRHQTFPFVGPAMPARVQRRDAAIIRETLRCNIVRTSHYPQSTEFLDACDEIGLLVLEEIPGWQHIGDDDWKQLSLDNLRRMIQRDCNHPSIILWGVRINESQDDHEFYARTNALAHQLDPTRQTGGVRYIKSSELLEDVFTINDFDWPLTEPYHPRYLNTEFIGHTYPVKQSDDNARHREHALRHVRTHDQLASNPQYAGGIAWCAFDYNTHLQFGSGDRVCYHGVADIFRELKPAAAFYRSQIDPNKELVLEPVFHWASGDEAVRFTDALICSNCDSLKLYVNRGSGWEQIVQAEPDREHFPHLKYPPFVIPMSLRHATFGDLRIEGYWEGNLMITRDFSGDGVDRDFVLVPDDRVLIADEADCTRIAMRVTDQFGNVRPLASDPIVLTLEGPGELIGDNPFSLVGGRGAVWIRSKETPGTIRLRAKHPRLGEKVAEVKVEQAPPELV